MSNNTGAFTGLQILFERAPEKFHMVFASDHPISLMFFFFFFFFFLPEVPFLSRMAYVAFIIIAFGVIWSLIEDKDQTGKAIEFEKDMFKASTGYNITAAGIIISLAIFYYVFW